MFETWPREREAAASVFIQEFEGKEFADSLHQHDSFELCFILRGAGRWQLGAATGAFSAGALLLCPPRSLHAWRSGGSAGEPSPCSGVVLRFREEALPRTLLKLPEMKGLKELRSRMDRALRFEVSDRERLRARLRSVDRAQGALKLARFYVALELVASFRDSQVIEEQREAGYVPARELARVEVLKAFMQARFADAITRGQVAAEVGLEEAAFSRFFRRAMGTTFVDYLASLRVRHAAGLLGSRRDLSLQEVAERSGFGSLPSLHRQFKKRLGTTPDSYRKAANSEFLAP
ncbi:AraC family transcriptional regulator [Pelagicoccus enzymogenes]|uniref:AraC family transcriptional regulator n=1 Tax=Pelagicoccus enzymogenes TaxID=2773457 RepID=UPI00280F6244|nr:AraC family transcriptional regulator [Pelagicoccus enzymogenes]MDQ8197786.1 AraC family transcriptional regulator [Pelagicoccus enzymogenes]